jgi:hypothetical protein
LGTGISQYSGRGVYHQDQHIQQNEIAEQLTKLKNHGETLDGRALRVYHVA